MILEGRKPRGFIRRNTYHNSQLSNKETPLVPTSEPYQDQTMGKPKTKIVMYNSVASQRWRWRWREGDIYLSRFLLFGYSTITTTCKNIANFLFNLNLHNFSEKTCCSSERLTYIGDPLGACIPGLYKGKFSLSLRRPEQGLHRPKNSSTRRPRLFSTRRVHSRVFPVIQLLPCVDLSILWLDAFVPENFYLYALKPMRRPMQ